MWSSKSFQNKVSAKPIATRLGFVVFHRSRSGGPDTVPSTAYEQQLETPMNIKHILRGRFWTQLRIQNSACRRFTTPPFAFRRHRTPSHSSNQLFLSLTSIFINLAGHSHRIPADVGFLLYKVVMYLKEMSREHDLLLALFTVHHQYMNSISFPSAPRVKAIKVAAFP